MDLEKTLCPSSWCCDTDDAVTTLMNLKIRIGLSGVITVH
jgi:hypothetical protein